MITAYAPGSPMLKAYIRTNGIKAAFVFKEDNRKWQVYIGDPVSRQGFKEGQPFKTQREALAHACKIGDLIASVKE